MRPSTILASILAYLIGGGLGFLGVRLAEVKVPEIAFLVGAIVATWTAAILYRRSASTNGEEAKRDRSWVKGMLGVAFAFTGLLLGILLEAFFQPFVKPYVSIPAAIVGNLFWPHLFFEPILSFVRSAAASGSGRKS